MEPYPDSLEDLYFLGAETLNRLSKISLNPDDLAKLYISEVEDFFKKEHDSIGKQLLTYANHLFMTWASKPHPREVGYFINKKRLPVPYEKHFSFLSLLGLSFEHYVTLDNYVRCRAYLQPHSPDQDPTLKFPSTIRSLVESTVKV